MNHARLSVLAIGESMIELTDEGDQLVSWTFAGDALNWAAAISQALPGADVHHLCAVGDDSRSAGFSTFCRALGVDTSISPVLPGRNMGIYWISTVNGDRRFRYWRGESAAREHLQSCQQVLAHQSPDVLMFSNITLAIAGDRAADFLDEVAHARSTGCTVVYDTNYRDALWWDRARTREVEADALNAADYVHASLDDVQSVWGEGLAEFVRRLEHAGVAEAVITDGAGDVVIAQKGTTTAARPPRIDPVDTSGAGDAFFGTYVGCRLASTTVDEAIAAATDVCAEVVRHRGALTYRTARRSGRPSTPG